MAKKNIDVEKHRINEKSELSGLSFMSIQGSGGINAETIFREELLKDDSDYKSKEFTVKDQVKLKRVTNKIKEKIQGMTENKVGRVTRIIKDENGKTVQVEVDFWDTVPARIPIRPSFLILVKSAKGSLFSRAKKAITKPIISFLTYLIDLLK